MNPDPLRRSALRAPATPDAALRIVLVYAAFAAVWIALSDHALTMLVSDLEMVAVFATLKGWLFVAITSFLVYGLIKLHEHQLQGEKDQRGRMEQVLEDTDAQIRWLGDNLPDSYLFQYARNPDGTPRFLYVGAAVEKVHQLKPAEVTGEAGKLYGQITADHRASFLAAEQDSRGRMADLDFSFEFSRPDGQVRWLHIRSRPRRTPAGAVIWDGVATDVTAAKAAEDALRESEARLHGLLMMLPDAMLVNQNNAITFVNRSGLALWRAERPEQILGKSPFELIHPGDHAEVQARIKNLQDTGAQQPLWECRIVALDGTVVPVESTAVVLMDGGRQTIQVVVRDITARKHTENALRAHEAILEETGRIAKVGGWSFEVATGEGYWTDEVARIHDLDPALGISRDAALAYYTPESRARIEAAIKAAVEHGTPYDLELELISAKAVHKWIRTIGHPVVEGGRVTRVHGSYQDISERRRIDEERERQQRRMALLADISRRLVVSNSPAELLNGIFSDLASELNVDIYANYMVRPDGKGLCLESSRGLTSAQEKAFAELEFGVSLCGLVAQRRERLVFADLPSVSVPQAAGIIALGVKAYAGHPLLAGERLIGTISFGSRSLVRYSDDDVRLMKAVADQVSAALDRGRLLAALREGEERFREVVENIQEVFWLSDVAKERVMYVSPGFATIWGRPEASIVASIGVWRDSLHPADRERIIAAAHTKQVLGTYHETYRIVRPDGSVRWIRDRAFPVKDAAGRVTRIVGVAEDITEQRELEAKFLRSQRVEAIGTLAGGVAHDLNNILAPVLMISGLLKDRLPSAEDQQAIEMLEVSARRGAAIIRQLLTFSRGASGERIVLQARHLLKEMVVLMRETFPREIAIEDNVSPELWTVEGDPTQLHQVLMNLCVNARDAMPAGGRLLLAAENVELDEAQAHLYPGARPGRYVQIGVGDTGQGISEENLSRIFDPFFTTKPIGQGTGLGLSTVLGIVKSHGGFLNVKSAPGEGSSFSVYLPAAALGCGGEALSSPEAPPQGKSELILVVDDEPNITAGLRLLLEKNQYRVLTAANGREALIAFVEQHEAIRLVLTDTMMPVMSGTALIRALRTIQPGLRIVAMTGQMLDGSREELEGLGVTEIAAKPCRNDQLLAMIRRQLDA